MNQIDQGLGEGVARPAFAPHTTSPSGGRPLPGAASPPVPVAAASCRRAAARPWCSLAAAPPTAQEFGGAGAHPVARPLQQAIGAMRVLSPTTDKAPGSRGPASRDHLREPDTATRAPAQPPLIRLANELEDPPRPGDGVHAGGARRQAHAAAYGPQTIELADRLGLPELAPSCGWRSVTESDRGSRWRSSRALREYARHPSRRAAED
jgi:hypothetical protein